MSDFTFRDPLTGIIRFNDANVIHIGYEPSSEDITITAQNDETGTSKTINVNMSGGGGSAVLGQKTITENGTYDASDDGLDGYDQVTVNVPATGYTIEDIASHNYSGDIVFNGTNFSALFGGSAVTSFWGDNCTTITGNAFDGCTSLKSVYAGGSSSAVGSYATRGCSILKAWRFPRFKTTSSVGGNGFQGCTSLQLTDFGSAKVFCPGLPANTPLEIIICRSTSGVQALQTATALDNSSAFKDGGTGGKVYIPQVLYDHLGDGTALDYESATNWSVYVAYGTIEFLQLEGSPYEQPDFYYEV